MSRSEEWFPGGLRGGRESGGRSRKARKVHYEEEGGGSPLEEEGACRACTDFHTWAMGKEKGEENAKKDKQDDTKSTNNAENQTGNMSLFRSSARKDCPLDKDELGVHTWSFLHTMAAYYPSKPTLQQQTNMDQFIHLLSQFYPCNHCASDFREEIKNDPPEVKSSHDLSQWMCRAHNKVNRKMGKPEFDCSLVGQRWKYGWENGSCD